jgi:hypothetical protein
MAIAPSYPVITMPHDCPARPNSTAMLRRPICFGALVLGMLATGVRAVDLTAEEKAFLDQHIVDVVKIEPVRMSDASVLSAFATPIYILNIAMEEGNGITNQSTVTAVRQGGKLVGLSRPGTNMECPEIQKMFRKDFKLGNDNDARTLQAALDAIFPISDHGDKKAEQFRHAGNQWVFVRGEFFEKKMGFVVTTDAAKAVTAVSYSLRLP